MSMNDEKDAIILGLNKENEALRAQMEAVIADSLRASQIRTDFTANVSHELKTPLTSIKGFADMLTGGMVHDEESKMRFVTMISVEADRMISLINDILMISELETLPITQPIEHTEALPVAFEVAELLSSAAEDAGVSIRVSGNGGSVPVERRRLRELLVNLMENAVKYNERGGSVNVTVAETGTVTSISVEDTGIGIPAEHQDRVFERFYRVDKGRSKKTGGTGLGLAIVKHIAALYGGELTLRSVPGEGTAITVSFPGACRKKPG